MYKIMYPYNKFVREKKKSKWTPKQNIYTTKICNKKIDISKLFSNLKNGRFTYLKWKIYNKIIVVTGKVEERWVVLRWEDDAGGEGAY